MHPCVLVGLQAVVATLRWAALHAPSLHAEQNMVDNSRAADMPGLDNVLPAEARADQALQQQSHASQDLPDGAQEAQGSAATTISRCVAAWRSALTIVIASS